MENSSFTALCACYGISRETGYVTLSRYRHEGRAGLADRSRRPHSSPHQTPAALVDQLVELASPASRLGLQEIALATPATRAPYPWPSPSTAGLWLRWLFQEYGLPNRLRSDNGPSFASCALARLPQLSLWLLKCGIQPGLIEPGHPGQNPQHERMHRTLKAAAIRPPAGDCRAQRRRFTDFRREFNAERPHESLGMQPPTTCY